jgi:hypothetical protein
MRGVEQALEMAEQEERAESLREDSIFEEARAATT